MAAPRSSPAYKICAFARRARCGARLAASEGISQQIHLLPSRRRRLKSPSQHAISSPATSFAPQLSPTRARPRAARAASSPPRTRAAGGLSRWCGSCSRCARPARRRTRRRRSACRGTGSASSSRAPSSSAAVAAAEAEARRRAPSRPARFWRGSSSSARRRRDGRREKLVVLQQRGADEVARRGDDAQQRQTSSACARRRRSRGAGPDRAPPASRSACSRAARRSASSSPRAGRPRSASVVLAGDGRVLEADGLRVAGRRPGPAAPFARARSTPQASVGRAASGGRAARLGRAT